MRQVNKNAICLGEKWLPYRAAEAEYTFTVHSVFNRVINISVGGRRLLSIAASGTGGSSTFLSLPDKELDFGVASGESCVLRAGRLILPGIIINFDKAPLWKGPIGREYRQKTIKKENIAAFKAVLDRKAPRESAWRSINSDSGGKFAGLKAVKELRENPSLARNLIGLGMGLTPAGDDMVLGFLAIVNHTCCNRDYINMLRGIVSNSTQKTTIISENMLANALNCDYHELLQNSLRDLCEGEQEDIYISTASLINLGASSGSDIACGMYFGMIGLE